MKKDMKKPELTATITNVHLVYKSMEDIATDVLDLTVDEGRKPTDEGVRVERDAFIYQPSVYHG